MVHEDLGLYATYITRTSLGNLGAQDEDWESTLKVIAYCYFAMNVVFLLITHYFKVKIQYVNLAVDDLIISPSDFAVLVYNLPKNKTQEEVREHLQKSMEGQIDIKEVIYTYQIDEIVNLGIKRHQKMLILQKRDIFKQRKLNELGLTENEAVKQGVRLEPEVLSIGLCRNVPFPSKEEVIKEVQEIDNKLEQLNKDLEVNTERELYRGVAVVIVNKQSCK